MQNAHVCNVAKRDKGQINIFAARNMMVYWSYPVKWTCFNSCTAWKINTSKHPTLSTQGLCLSQRALLWPAVAAVTWCWRWFESWYFMPSQLAKVIREKHNSPTQKLLFFLKFNPQFMLHVILWERAKGTGERQEVKNTQAEFLAAGEACVAIILTYS